MIKAVYAQRTALAVSASIECSGSNAKATLTIVEMITHVSITYQNFPLINSLIHFYHHRASFLLSSGDIRKIDCNNSLIHVCIVL